MWARPTCRLPLLGLSRRARAIWAQTERRASADVLPALISFDRCEVANASVMRACRALIADFSASRAVSSSMCSVSVPVVSSAASIAMNATA